MKTTQILGLAFALFAITFAAPTPEPETEVDTHVDYFICNNC